MLGEGKETVSVDLINDDGQTSVLVFHSFSATLILSTLKSPFFHLTGMPRNQVICLDDLELS